MAELTTERLQRLLDDIEAWTTLHDPTRIPATLYHYTNLDGLQGILKDNALHATSSISLNDESEWKFGKAVISRYTRVAGALENIAHQAVLSQGAPESVFVTCFCRERNLLSMWRSYTAQGGGYCLGFDGKQLGALQRDDMRVGQKGTQIFEIHYGEALPLAMEKLVRPDAYLGAMWVLENMIKDSGFKEEQEWRIVAPDPPAELMSFRPCHASVKASIELKHHSGKLPLKTITFGPTLRPDTEIILKWMLKKYGYEHVEVKPANIPFRL